MFFLTLQLLICRFLIYSAMSATRSKIYLELAVYSFQPNFANHLESLFSVPIYLLFVSISEIFDFAHQVPL